jgi:hypothetical protein
VLCLLEKFEVAFGDTAHGRYELHLVSDDHARFARFGRFDNERTLGEIGLQNNDLLTIDFGMQRALSGHDRRPRIGIRIPKAGGMYMLADDLTTLGEIKRDIQAHTGLPVDRQQLVFETIPLVDDARTLRDYGIEEDEDGGFYATLDLIVGWKAQKARANNFMTKIRDPIGMTDPAGLSLKEELTALSYEPRRRYHQGLPMTESNTEEQRLAFLAGPAPPRLYDPAPYHRPRQSTTRRKGRKNRKTRARRRF